MGTNQQFSLRWNNYLHHITEAFDSLREDENLVDVTLCCEGRKIKAHKMLLSACSSYFREIFKENPCHHPIIVFHNVKYEDLWALVSFMYKGEVNVEQEGLSSFLNTAELLEVQGLTGGPSRTDETDDENSQEPKTNRKQSSPKSSTRPESPVPKRRKLPTDDGLKKEHTKSPLALVKTEPDFYGGDSLDESEDQKPQSLSLSQKLDKNYDNNYSDENMDGSSEIGTAGGSTNEMTNMPDSLQAPLPVLHTCAECGKTFRHSGSLSMHKRLHIGDTYCTFCGRVFSRKYYLKLHMKMHHYQGQPPSVSSEIIQKTNLINK
ncbi:broad-complex core protein isoforms 1/2/3/4/5 isoform X3 [Halyomorpha halys]|uniref:broad-complex core protein isoforms 1/2/3/4/5 isoform X3 n=1 Tax=Halyomorpha halys TaxID=286706 RepID=UPI0006D4D34E|nr:broad-complex core protein isoforms 1/2/3/4/5-like isoform X3 [Halyomorpha halys]